MFDERAFVSQVEAASPEELAGILMRPTLAEEKALRAHLGDERYQRMHGMALRRSMSRGVQTQAKGNVVVIHGIMGAELSVSSAGSGDLTWVNAFRIMRGWLDRLRLSDDGRADYNSKFKVIASGIMKRYYGELLLSLSEKWNVHAFWFDWRKDLNVAADDLNTKINEWFGSETPAHIVAHSMGGLVARTFIKKYPDRWNSMLDTESKGKAGGRLVMLGTPNYGSFAIPQVITGIEGLVRKLAVLDLRHSARDLLSTFNSFVGSYQMLPSPFAMPDMKRLYNSGTYAGYNVPQRHLDNALKSHDFLRDVIEPERMIYVAGYDQPTFFDIKNWEKLNSIDSYELTPDGDGRVPHTLGLFKSDDGKRLLIPTYFVKEDHGNLSSNSKILGALDELLESGETGDLDASMPARRSLDVEDKAKLKEQFLKKQQEDEARLVSSLGRMRSRSVEVSGTAAASLSDLNVDSTIKPEYISPEERKVEETITRGFLAFRDEEQASAEADFSSEREIEFASIEIGLVYDGIQSLPYDRIRSNDGDPIDAIALGHYIGVQPQAAELVMDKALSGALLGRGANDHSEIDKSDLILTQYTERGIIHGKLGQPFLMPDTRQMNGKKGKTDRIVAIAGMGEPGRFGVPELTVLARELCWSLGRLNKLHLATVLIGTGAGNIAMRDAVSAWMNGIRRAVTGSAYDAGRRLKRITFVEADPRRVKPLQDLILNEIERQMKLGLKIDFKGISKQKLAAMKDEELEWDRRDWERRKAQGDHRTNVPTRVTLSFEPNRNAYRFGAISDTASVPERETRLDPALVWQANDELAGEQKPALQLERGRLLEELLMPDDLRRELYSNAPLVMMLDSTTARIHWEMVAQPASSATGDGASHGDEAQFEYTDNFLGTCRGFTRQLRTTFAPPPEPPPPPRRVLRVLVVADPAEDAHLPGAQDEGVAVADLFESYNVAYKEDLDTRIEVQRLFGPLEATRTNVLRELMSRQYDVLHFAGHCVYAWGGDPSLSGWIFNKKRKELLSANELNRIDRIPKFVFSNACESGITPDRAQDRSVDLAPSFAEAFFERGVANFVCTAWPVDDLAARVFALEVYSGLLGLNSGNLNSRPARRVEGAKPMHEAMRDARVKIASTANGRTTWGAYQHYGNPYFQLFYSAASKLSRTKDNEAYIVRTTARGRRPRSKQENGARQNTNLKARKKGAGRA